MSQPPFRTTPGAPHHYSNLPQTHSPTQRRDRPLTYSTIQFSAQQQSWPPGPRQNHSQTYPTAHSPLAWLPHSQSPLGEAIRHRVPHSPTQARSQTLLPTRAVYSAPPRLRRRPKSIPSQGDIDYRWEVMDETYLNHAIYDSLQSQTGLEDEQMNEAVARSLQDWEDRVDEEARQARALGKEADNMVMKQTFSRQKEEEDMQQAIFQSFGGRQIPVREYVQPKVKEPEKPRRYGGPGQYELANLVSPWFDLEGVLKQMHLSGEGRNNIKDIAEELSKTVDGLACPGKLLEGQKCKGQCACARIRVGEGPGNPGAVPMSKRCPSGRRCDECKICQKQYEAGWSQTIKDL